MIRLKTSALVYATCPQLFKTVKVPARVECKGEFTRGMVIADFREYPFDAKHVSICIDADSTRVMERIVAAFTR